MFIAKIFGREFTKATYNEFIKKIKHLNPNLSGDIEWETYQKKLEGILMKFELRQCLNTTSRKYIYHLKNTHISKRWPRYKVKDKVRLYAELGRDKEIYLGEYIIKNVYRIYCTEEYIRFYAIEDRYLDDVIKEIKVGDNKSFKLLCYREGYTPDEFIKWFCKKRYKGFYTKFALLR